MQFPGVEPALFIAGYWLGREADTANTRLEKHFLPRKHNVELIKQNCKLYYEQLGHRLSQLKAELSRINALQKSLIKASNIDPASKFNFDKPPLLRKIEWENDILKKATALLMSDSIKR